MILAKVRRMEDKIIDIDNRLSFANNQRVRASSSITTEDEVIDMNNSADNQHAPSSTATSFPSLPTQASVLTNLTNENAKKRQKCTNECDKLIRKLLGSVFTAKELFYGGLSAGKEVWMGREIQKSALCPQRLATLVLEPAKSQFPSLYIESQKRLKTIVSEKCRKLRGYVKQKAHISGKTIEDVLQKMDEEERFRSPLT